MTSSCDMCFRNDSTNYVSSGEHCCRYRYMHVFGWKYDGLCKAIAGIWGNTELEVRTAPVAAGHSVNR